MASIELAAAAKLPFPQGAWEMLKYLNEELGLNILQSEGEALLCEFLARHFPHGIGKQEDGSVV